MGSIRDNILTALVSRLATIPGWDAQLRGVENTSATGVTAVVSFLTEEKQFANNEQYDCSMEVVVWIIGHVEDASVSLDASNAYRYLDRLVTLAEKKVHAPDSWGLNPDFTDVRINGHDVRDPEDESTVEALLRLTFTYRHQLANPEA